ncbi:MAG TPA: YceK/YidQ family lipoprotein [Dongiaceae bacterium]|nr:YceK/YidQ family lipoprotein [Dongiaceae bacterium]
MHKIKLLILTLAAGLLAGCMSLSTHPQTGQPVLYPGVKADCECLREAPQQDPHGFYFTAYCVIDFPFSCLADTLYLPADLYHVAHASPPADSFTFATNGVAR